MISGKIGITDRILLKDGSLDESEWEIMKTHPQIGHDMLRSIPFLNDVLPIVLYHHEKYDGSGYPTGLSGKKHTLRWQESSLSQMLLMP